MKTSKLFIVLCCTFSLLISCNSSTPVMEQKVEYLNHSVTIPTDWTFEAKVLNGGLEHQIACSNKNGSQHFMLQWLDEQRDVAEYMEVVRGLFKDQRFYSNAALMATATAKFQEHPTTYFEFSGNYQDFRYTGRVMVFNANNKTYYISYYSDVDVLPQNIGELILNSIKLSEKS